MDEHTARAKALERPFAMPRRSRLCTRSVPGDGPVGHTDEGLSAGLHVGRGALSFSRVASALQGAEHTLPVMQPIASGIRVGAVSAEDPLLVR